MTYRSFLLVLALAILCAWAPVRGEGRSAATPGGREVLVTAARELVPRWVASLLLHRGRVVRQIEADEYLLPLVSLITLIGGLCHLGPEGLGGSAIVTYRSDVLVGVAVVAAVVLLVAQLRRVGLLFEERVWWRYARDVPYYSSILFHVPLREYKRLFGQPPMRDVERLREAARG